MFYTSLHVDMLPLQYIVLINIVFWLLPSICGIVQCQCQETNVCHGNHVSQILGNIADVKRGDIDLHIHNICLSVINIIEMVGGGGVPLGVRCDGKCLGILGLISPFL